MTKLIITAILAFTVLLGCLILRLADGYQKEITIAGVIEPLPSKVKWSGWPVVAPDIDVNATVTIVDMNSSVIETERYQ